MFKLHATKTRPASCYLQFEKEKLKVLALLINESCSRTTEPLFVDAPLYCARVLYMLHQLVGLSVMQRITDRTAGFYKSVIDAYLKMGAQFTFLLYEIGSAVIKCTYKTKHSYITWNQLQQCQNVRTFYNRAPSAELEQFPVCSGRTFSSML